MNFHELEQQMDLDEHAKHGEQAKCYRCDRIAFAAMVVWVCVFGGGITAALAWFLATD